MADRLRKAVHNLDASELADVRRAYAEIMELRDNRGYDQAAGFHGIPNWWCWHHERRTRDGRYPVALFLPWHRAYLYDFEMRLRDRVPGVTLPWWDWTKDPGLPSAFTEPTTADGARNPLLSGFIDHANANPPARHWTRRDPSPPPVIDPDLIARVMDQTDYMQFTAELESEVHDNIHGWVGGDMGNPAFAAFDPIFWAHHCMIDRLWAVWQNRNGIARIPPALLDEVLDPFPFTVRQVLDVRGLHYDYAASSASVAFGG